MGRAERPYDHSSSRSTWGTNAKVVAKALELGTGERLGHDVRGIVRGANTEDVEFARINEISSRVVFDVEVLYFGVPSLVLGELAGRVVVTVEGHSVRERHV